jgi:hypothetical protein
LLLAYLEEVGGLLITEVPAGHPSKEIWPKGSKVRRIDGVRIPDSDAQGAGDELVVSYQSFGAERFQESVEGRSVEVIEVKKKLNRLVLGQVIVGTDMFGLEYRPSEILPVVVAGVGDPALELICEKRGIRCWIQPSAFDKSSS